MTRGPVSGIALEEALPLAKLRGMVFFLRPDPESPCDFEVLNNREVVFVRVKRSRCLHCSLAEMESLYRESIQKLRAIPLSPSARRELWVCSRYGRWRFFRISETGMEEITVPGPDIGQSAGKDTNQIATPDTSKDIIQDTGRLTGQCISPDTIRDTTPDTSQGPGHGTEKCSDQSTGEGRVGTPA